MRWSLWLFLVAAILVSCPSRKGHSQLVEREEYPIIELAHNWDVAIFFDIYDPISFYIYIDSMRDDCKIIFVTHKLPNGELYIREFIKNIDKTVKIDWLEDIKHCELYDGYICNGLDGSEIWVLHKTPSNEVNVFQFWNPESQQASRIGGDLVSLKKELINAYNIDSLRNEFLKDLRRGRYWNYGEAILYH